MYHYGFGFFPFFPLFGIVFWIIILSLIFRGWGRWHHRWHDHADKSAEDIVRDRFAHGEINEKEYREKMRVLKEQTK